MSASPAANIGRSLRSKAIIAAMESSDARIGSTSVLKPTNCVIGSPARRNVFMAFWTTLAWAVSFSIWNCW